VERDDVWWTVVGVVEDVRDRGLGDDVESTIYLPFSQWPTRAQVVVLRTTVLPSTLADEARQAVWTLDDALPVTEMRTFDDVVAASTAAERYRAWLVGSFGVLATLLAVIGIAGVTAHAVLRRTGEIGLRMALGAPRAEVVRLVIARTARYAVLGIAIGMVGAALVTRALGRYLYGVEPIDVTTFVAAALSMLAVVLAAAFIPARRAAAIAPLEALRHE
jgi:putative ABC transport system permease protein